MSSKLLSGEMAINVAPKIVSGRVLKTSILFVSSHPFQTQISKSQISWQWNLEKTISATLEIEWILLKIYVPIWTKFSSFRASFSSWSLSAQKKTITWCWTEALFDYFSVIVWTFWTGCKSSCRWPPRHRWRRPWPRPCAWSATSHLSYILHLLRKLLSFKGTPK